MPSSSASTPRSRCAGRAAPRAAGLGGSSPPRAHARPPRPRPRRSPGRATGSCARSSRRGISWSATRRRTCGHTHAPVRRRFARCPRGLVMVVAARQADPAATLFISPVAECAAQDKSPGRWWLVPGIDMVNSRDSPSVRRVDRARGEIELVAARAIAEGAGRGCAERMPALPAACGAAKSQRLPPPTRPCHCARCC